MNNEIQTVVSAFDLHFPQTDFPTWRALLDFIRRNRVDVFVFGGDQLTCESISHHTKGKGKYRKFGQMKKELDGFRRRILEPLEALLPKSCEKVWLTGNHEDWLEQLFEEQPELAGLINFDKYLKLSERGWKVKPQGGHFKKGHLKWIHGDVLFGNHSKNALNTFVGNVVYGHFHAATSETKIMPHDDKSKWQSWSTGCVGRLDASYLKKRPTGWLNQFGITEFRAGGYFNHFPVTVFGGKFSYGGRLYSAAGAR